MSLTAPLVCGAVLSFQPYKLHYVTSEYTSPADGQFHDPPLIYHLEHDPGENWPLDPSDPAYVQTRATVEAAVKTHQANLKYVPPQMAKGSNADFAVCGDPNSKAKYPQYPNCTLTPSNWDVFVCGPLGPTLDAVNGAAAFRGLPLAEQPAAVPQFQQA